MAIPDIFFFSPSSPSGAVALICSYLIACHSSRWITYSCFIVILVSWVSCEPPPPRLFCVSCKCICWTVSFSWTFFFFFSWACVICATVIECGSKKPLRKTQGWLPGGFAQSRGNFPHRRPGAVVCQPPLAPLAAIVATAVNHALYESEEQSIAWLMNPNSSQLFRVGIHSRIWRIWLGTWKAKRQGSTKAGGD